VAGDVNVIVLVVVVVVREVVVSKPTWGMYVCVFHYILPFHRMLRVNPQLIPAPL
jgi:hypothetical protein